MRKTHKKIIGLFGLIVVVATTIYAAWLPGPEASAMSSMTDTITVRVVSSGPNIDVTSPESGLVTTDSTQIINYNYENVNEVTVTVQYTDADGNTQSFLLETFTPDRAVGTRQFVLDMKDPRFGFGDYVVTITGTSEEVSGEDGDSIAFTHIPVTTVIEEDKKTGEVNAILDYDETDPSIKKIEINLYDKNGKLIEGISPIIVDAPTKKVILPLAEHGIKPGDYVVKTKALGEDGGALYKDYLVNLKYEIIEVPDTGGLFAGLNISKSDYLITGLVVFFLTGLTGLFYIAKKKNNKR